MVISMNTNVIGRVGTVAALLFTFWPGEPHAQGGSAGGVVGKQNKDVSGGNEIERSRIKPTHSSPPNRAAATPHSAAIGGRWTWQASCPVVGALHGFVTLAQRADTFTGEFGRTNSWDQGTIVNGSLHGTSISFTRILAEGGNQHWTGTTWRGEDSRQHMSLTTETSVGECTVDAKKL